MHDENQINYFAETNFRNERRKFGIKRGDRRRHMYLIGKTGMGKSTMLENMIIQDIRNGEGVAVVDPHGDLVEKILDYIPSERINDVIYFNPSDYDFPIAFNILEKVDPQYKHLVSNGLVGVFKKIWADSWGPRLEYILINTILALLEYPGSTLLGVMRMLVDGAFRKKVVKKIEDPVVRSFWINEFNNYSEKFRNEAIAPIQNKVGQFLSSSLIRNIVGQPKSSLDMRQLMDEGKIILLNLSKGRIGEENSALLGAMMITKMQLAAMSRVDIPEEERRDFYLYVDEFQNFATESFAGILSEARKYRLNLIMAHQYIEQLGDEVRAAVFGNVGTMVAFRVGATDAEELEKEFAPTFTGEDVVTLPAYHTYLRLMIDGVASDPFSATTMPPLSGKTENKDKVIRVSRERYANPRLKVEQAILQWSDHPSGAQKNDDSDSANEEVDVHESEFETEQNATDTEDLKVEDTQTPKRSKLPLPPAKPTASDSQSSATVDMSIIPAPPYQSKDQSPPAVNLAALTDVEAESPEEQQATPSIPQWAPAHAEMQVKKPREGINFAAQFNQQFDASPAPSMPPVSLVEQDSEKVEEPVVKAPKPAKNTSVSASAEAPRKKEQKKNVERTKEKKLSAPSVRKQLAVQPKFSSIAEALPTMPTPISAGGVKKKQSHSDSSPSSAKQQQQPVPQKSVQQQATNQQPTQQPSADDTAPKKKRRRRRKRKKSNSGSTQQSQPTTNSRPASEGTPKSIQPGQRIQF